MSFVNKPLENSGKHQDSGTPDLQKTKSMVVKKTCKVQVHIMGNQSWNSCRKVVCDHEFTFSSATSQSLTIHGHFLQLKYGAHAVQMHL